MRKRSKKTGKIVNFEEAREKRRAKREEEALKRSAKAQALKAADEKNAKGRRLAAKKSRRRYFAAAVLLVIFLFAGFSMFNIINLKMQEADAIELQRKLTAEKESLQEELSIVHSPAYVEQQARIQLKMIKPGEKLYVFPPTAEQETEAPADSAESENE